MDLNKTNIKHCVPVWWEVLQQNRELKLSPGQWAHSKQSLFAIIRKAFTPHLRIIHIMDHVKYSSTQTFRLNWIPILISQCHLKQQTTIAPLTSEIQEKISPQLIDRHDIDY